jgi:hypothetical protein
MRGSGVETVHTRGKTWRVCCNLKLSFVVGPALLHLSFNAQLLFYLPPCLTFTNYTFCPHCVFMCFVWISEQTAVISLCSINWLLFITGTECVYCAVRTESSRLTLSLELGMLLHEALRYRSKGRGFDSPWVNGIFHLLNPTGRTMALVSTQ